jgi:epoxide hydrolase
MSRAIEPFQLAIPEEALDDLRRRLRATRWPDPQTAGGWLQGVPLERAKALVDYWQSRYDWRRCEALLNAFGQYRVEIDGLGIHFLHVRSPVVGALPLLMTHGWPGSVIEFHKVIGPLTDPAAHGGNEKDAFHVVVPSLPGFGFSDKPARTGWSTERIAVAWNILMQRLGYDSYVAQGGDWGAIVTTALAQRAPPGLIAIHLTTVVAEAPHDRTALTEEESAEIAANAQRGKTEFGYAMIQSTKPQTLGYGLADSPAGQAAWIYEKFHGWTDRAGEPEVVLSRDELLDNIMLYWLPNTAAASARLYWESLATAVRPRNIAVPVGCSIFPMELSRPPRKWAEQHWSNIFYWNHLQRGGHFAGLEQPAVFIEELRNCFRLVR